MLPITPFTGSFTCTDFDTSGDRAAFNTGTEGSFAAATSGSTAIAYPLDHALFPSNLGAIQVQLKTAGSAARITFQTDTEQPRERAVLRGLRVGARSGCSVTIPLAFTQMLIPASQTEDLQLTARVLVAARPRVIRPPSASPGRAPGSRAVSTTGRSSRTKPDCPSATMADPRHVSAWTTPTQNPKNGTAIYRYDFSLTDPAPQQVWTDDGGPDSRPVLPGRAAGLGQR